MGHAIELKSTDGFAFDAYVALPKKAPRAAIVVLQEIFGVNAHIRAVADGFALAGFLVIAPATFSRLQKDVNLGYGAGDVAAGRDLKTRADINRWLLWESSSWFPSCYVYLVENCVKPLLGGEADPAVIAAQDAQFHKLASILDQRLSQHTWVAGDHVTIADIALAAPMHLHGWQQLPLDNHRHLKRWLTTAIEGLPCWQKTMIYQGFTTQKPN